MNKNEEITGLWLTTLCSDFARFYIVPTFQRLYPTFPGGRFAPLKQRDVRTYRTYTISFEISSTSTVCPR